MQLVPVHIGDEVQALARGAKGIEREDRHVRAQVRAADADVHHVGDAGIAAHLLGVLQHGIERAMHLGQPVRDIGTVPGQRQSLGAAQQRVQHGPAFGVVDGLAREHGIALRSKATGLGHAQQQGLGGQVPQVLGEVGEHLRGGLTEVRETLSILGEGVPKVQCAPLRVEQGLQRGPLGSLVTTEGHERATWTGKWKTAK